MRYSIKFSVGACELEPGDIIREGEVVSKGFHGDHTIITYAVGSTFGISSTAYGYGVLIRQDRFMFDIERSCSHATYLGWQAGTDQASWVFESDTPQEVYAKVLKGIEECDPAILEAYEPPDLSGKWADSWGPEQLACELDTTTEAEDFPLSMDQFEDAALTAFWYEIERACRKHEEVEK